MPDYDESRFFSAADLPLLDRFTQFALIAADEAVTDSGIEFGGDLGERTAVIFGTGAGARRTNDDAVGRFCAEGRRIHPAAIPRGLFSAPVSHVSMKYGLTGPAFTLSTACASSNHAIGQALLMLKSGMADVALAGGSEACFTLPFHKGWEALRVLAPDTCRPFSRDRKGFVLGEGAGVLVLETMDHARARGARIYAELAGFGFSADAHHILMPAAPGAAAAMRAALRMAGLNARDVDFINAHGTGTVANDVAETTALHQVFGAHAFNLTVSSTKSMHGHALGASGALEAVATALSLHHGIATPTANCTAPDPDCDLDYAFDGARELSIGAALSNALAFGGLNAVIAFRRMA